MKLKNKVDEVNEENLEVEQLKERDTLLRSIDDALQRLMVRFAPF